MLGRESAVTVTGAWSYASCALAAYLSGLPRDAEACEKSSDWQMALRLLQQCVEIDAEPFLQEAEPNTPTVPKMKLGTDATNSDKDLTGMLGSLRLLYLTWY